MLRKPIFRTLAGLAVGCTVLAGCKSTSVPRPEIILPTAYTASRGNPLGETPSYTRWWQAFNDPQLNTLVKRGLGANLDIRQAYERLVSANAALRGAGAGGRPQLDAGAGVSGYSSRSSTTHQTGVRATGSLDFRWGIDLWGRYRNERRAKEARRAAAAANLRVIRLAYLADLTSSYIDLQYFRHAIAAANQNIASYRKTLSLTRDMLSAGIATNLDVAQTKALVDAARAELPPLYKGRDGSANRIATLLGMTAIDFTRKLPKATRQPRPRAKAGLGYGTGVPADLLRNRPDIRREEFLLAASAADIGVAEAQLYPALTLSGSLDGSAIFASSNPATALTWSFGPSLLAPILDGRRLRANVDIAKADTRAQYLAWRKSVLKAVEEVQTAMAAVKRSNEQVQAYRRMLRSYQKARELARESYRGGTGIILDVLGVERSLSEGRLALADSLRQLAKDYVSLQVAIGGGAAVAGDLERLAPGNTRSVPRRRPPALPPATVAMPKKAIGKPASRGLRLKRAS